MSNSHNDVRSGIVEVVSRVFSLPPAVVEAGVSPDTIEGWDSGKHVELVVALEGRFGCMFDPEEIPDLTSLAQMEAAIRRHG
jgi:acyl carrier protein